MESGNRVLVGDIGSVRRIIARQCIQEQETQECRDGGNKQDLYYNGKQGQDLITSKFEHGTEVLGIWGVM